MTTKPKARKFRIRRQTPAENSQNGGQPKAREAAAGAAPDPLELIKREGLTGRQLRMASRVAQKHGLTYSSEFDAVHQLRLRGIDPFQRESMLDLVVPNADAEKKQKAEQAQAKVQLPQTVTNERGLQNAADAKTLNPMQQRMREISEIQQDISRRRRKKLGMLLARLAFFVLLPTILTGYYFFAMATPMYASNSQFMIIQNEGSASGGALGGLIPAQYAASQDSIATQAYLDSKDAMLRLDADAGFREHFSQESIDPIQRLDEDASNEAAYRIYRKTVKIGYDPTEGVIRMEVIAADPKVATEFSEKLLSYAEERANEQSQEKREDSIKDSLQIYEDAVEQRREAEERLIRLQVENGADPEAVIGAIRAQITNYEGFLIEKELELAALLDNARPSRAKVEGAQADIRRIKDQLIKLNDRMSATTQGSNSLAQQAVTLQLAQADLAAADANLQAARQGLEAARTEANRQVRYLTIAVRPIPSEEPSYPRAFENTILAFLIFAGIYLMLSLTSAILREQVTA